MCESRLQHREAVAAAARRAGKIDDERASVHAGDAAREQRVRRLRDRVGADRFRDPGRFAVDHRARRLRRHVARRDAGAAGREDECRVSASEAIAAAISSASSGTTLRSTS